MSIFMCGLLTSGVKSVDEGNQLLNRIASQSRGDIGGFTLSGKALVALLEKGLESDFDFDGQREEAEDFTDRLRDMLPTDEPVAIAGTLSTLVASDLKSRRTAKNITQEVLGNAIGVSRKVIGKWENHGTTQVNLDKAFAALARF